MLSLILNIALVLLLWRALSISYRRLTENQMLRQELGRLGRGQHGANFTPDWGHLIHKEAKLLAADMKPQTQILGHAETEHRIATWLEEQWCPFDDLTDRRDSAGIAKLIRSGIYLGKDIDNEVLSLEGQRAARRNASRG